MLDVLLGSLQCDVVRWWERPVVTFGMGLKGGKNVKWAWSVVGSPFHEIVDHFDRIFSSNAFCLADARSSSRRRLRLHDNGGQGMCTRLVIGELERGVPQGV